jgi:hypothetical protein
VIDFVPFAMYLLLLLLARSISLERTT